MLMQAVLNGLLSSSIYQDMIKANTNIKTMFLLQSSSYLVSGHYCCKQKSKQTHGKHVVVTTLAV